MLGVRCWVFDVGCWNYSGRPRSLSRTQHPTPNTYFFFLRQASVNRRHLSQALAQFFVERAFAKSPCPVALGARGRVHASVRREAEHVLKLRNRDVGDRHLHGAYEVPVDLRAVDAEVLQAKLALASLAAARAVASARVEPTDDGVVVV